MRAILDPRMNAAPPDLDPARDLAPKLAEARRSSEAMIARGELDPV